jgi:hypothetical protein
LLPDIFLWSLCGSDRIDATEGGEKAGRGAPRVQLFQPGSVSSQATSLKIARILVAAPLLDTAFPGREIAAPFRPTSRGSRSPSDSAFKLKVSASQRPVRTREAKPLDTRAAEYFTSSCCGRLQPFQRSWSATRSARSNVAWFPSLRGKDLFSTTEPGRSDPGGARRAPQITLKRFLFAVCIHHLQIRKMVQKFNTP